MEGGQLFGFCPGKATWDYETIAIYDVLVIAAKTGAMWDVGGISDQPQWFVGMLGWFLPLYDTVSFLSKVRTVLGDGKDKKSDPTAGPSTGGRSIGRKK
jgi:hypothetical protein